MPAPSESSEKKNIVIIGGGIIGCTSAYYLTRHPSFDPKKHTITLLEASDIAGGASGKAGGLLALWAYPSCLVPLSFRLHKELAEEHNGTEKWGYRGVGCGQIEAKGRDLPRSNDTTANNSSSTPGAEAKESVSLQKRTKEATDRLRKAGLPHDLDWIDAESKPAYDSMGDSTNTAQVHPFHFTTHMARLASEAGATIHTNAHVDRINYNDTAVESVTYTSTIRSQPPQTHTLPANTLILAAGPWTQTLHSRAPISGLRAHSVTIHPARPVSAYALFTSIRMARTATHTPSQTVGPEIYARPDEIYACGEGDRTVPLPRTTADVAVDQERCDEIVEQVSSVSEELRHGEVMARQACYLPIAAGGGPLVGWGGKEGLLVAAGHSCWGIQNGPGTGKLVSELVFDGGAKSAKVGSLDPGMFIR